MGEQTKPRKSRSRRTVLHTPATVHIDHPNSTDTLAPEILAVFGTAERVGKVIGIITMAGQVISVGETLAEPPNWVIYFHDLPPSQTLTLLVYESARIGKHSALASDSVTFTTGPQSPAENLSSGTFNNVTITYPKSGTTVTPTFSAYGTTDQTGEVIGDFADGSKIFTGTELQPPPYWVVQFTNTTRNSGCGLTVDIGSAEGSSSNITVS